MELVTKEEKELQLPATDTFHTMPNLLSKRPQIGENIINMSGEDTRESRLMVMGGLSGLVELMRKDKVAPDIKTFDQLLRLIPNTRENEIELLKIMEEFNVKPDISFYNQLIVLREKREDFKLAMETLSLLIEKEIEPNIMTYGALARCCKNPSSIKKFLNDLKDLEVRPNVEIMNTLITTMAVKLDVKTVTYLLKYCETEQVRVNKRLLHSVERFYQTYRQMIILREQGKLVPKSVNYEFIK